MKYIIVFILSSITLSAPAQNLDRLLILGPSITSYKGDLNKTYTKLSGSISVQIIPNKDKFFQTSLELNTGNVVGQNSTFYSSKDPSREPNTFFETSFTSLSYNFRAYLYRKNNIKFFIGQGIGGIRYVPKNEIGEKLIDKPITRNSDNETYNNIALILPRLIGISYLFKNDFGISLDITQLNPRTDYIDNISILGNSNKKDKIILYRLGIMIPIIYSKEKKETNTTESLL